MIERFTRIFSSSKKILAAAGLIFLAFLILDFNNRVEELFRLSAERDAMATEVADFRTTEQALQTQIAYANSDAAAEKWAREEAFMARPGDKPIIMLPDSKFTPQPTPEPVVTPMVVSNWQVWGLLFFGNQ
jgi:cell division protein FtsB